MGREKKRSGPGAMTGAHAKERHKKRLRAQTVSNPALLNARLEVPNMKSKHHSYYEIVENKDKKKKLEFEITGHRTPPPGFEFVPIGNPELTTACKELSREQDAMIFIVSNGWGNGSLAQQMNRVGHHIREQIVRQARLEVSDNGDSSDDQIPLGVPEPIPETQEEINAQADSAIRDLFPRIPNTDRRMVIEHAFKKGATKKGGPLVGLAPDIPLSRRVQLAVLAHIRHTHTRYDSLLKETSYSNARKAVEGLCLDVLVKWRGDEETGRDQLDEILREVIVISDSEGEDGDGEDEEADSSGVESGDLAAEPSYLPYPAAAPSSRTRRDPELEPAVEMQHPRRPLVYGERAVWRDEPARTYIRPLHPYMQRPPAIARRGFKRYEAALNARWGEAVTRVRHEMDHPQEAPRDVEYRVVPLHGQQQHPEQAPSPAYFYYGADAHDSPYHSGDGRSAPCPLDYPARGPVQSLMASDTAMQRTPSGGLSRGASPYADPRQARQTPQRVVVRASEARELLVPSVEARSPTTEQYPAAPVFVRTVSPRQMSRPPRGPIDNARHQPEPLDHGEPVTLKRRRMMEDEPYNPRDPPRLEPLPGRRLVSDGYHRPPVRYYPAQRVAIIPVTVPDDQAYYQRPRYEPHQGTEHAAIVLDDSDMDPPPPAAATFPVRDYRGNAISERREPAYRVVEARGGDTRYAPIVEYRRLPPTEYTRPPEPQDPPVYMERRASRPPQGPPPIPSGQPGTYDERPPPFPSPQEPQYVVHDPRAYEGGPRYPQHHDGYEPAPVFVRHVERHDQPRPVEHREQSEWQYSHGPPHEYQAPPPDEGTWGQPHGGAPPMQHSNSYDAHGGYPSYPSPQQQRQHQQQYPSNEPGYGDYPTHYDQPGP